MEARMFSVSPFCKLMFAARHSAGITSEERNIISKQSRVIMLESDNLQRMLPIVVLLLFPFPSSKRHRTARCP